MPEREMQQFNVYASDKGFICISQEVFGQEPVNTVVIHPEQVDSLIKWLKETKEELQSS